MRCLKCSIRTDVLIVVILNALLLEGFWLDARAAQAGRFSKTSKRNIIQRSDDWSDDYIDKIKNSTAQYNTYLDKMPEHKVHIEDLKWAGDDLTTTKDGGRESSGLEYGGISKNTSNSRRIKLHSNIARDADFSHANLSNTIRLNDLNKSKKFNKVDFDTLQSQAERLNLANNAIKYLDESVALAFSNIEQLNLAYNKMEHFNLSVDKYQVILFHRLKVLNLTGNCLKSFQSTHMNSLKGIDLSRNLFSEPKLINLSQLNGLEFLDLSCNHLSTFHMNMIQNMTSLIVLNLAGNYLSTISRNYFEGLTNVEVLILSNNNINNIESDAFEYLTNLQFLDLSYNKLSASSLHALQNIPDLSGLSVAYNDGLGNALQEFVTSWSIKELDVSHTGLFEIPAALAQSVHSLNLSRNHFTVS